MKKIKLLALIATFALALTITPATFAEDPQTATTPKNTPEELFQANENLTTSSPLNSSAFFAGLNVNDSSTINGIGWFAGNNITLSGTYDYAAAAGLVLDVSGKYKNDAFLFGSTININSEASLGRNLYAAADVLQIETNVPGSVFYYGEVLALGDNVTISGDLNINANTISLGNNVTIAGTLNYNDNATITGLDSATIGTTSPYTSATTTTTESSDSSSNFAGSVASFCFFLLSYLLFALLFALICPQFFRKLRDKTTKDYSAKQGIADFFIGLAVLVISPVVLIFALITVIGIPVVIVFSLLYIFALYASSMVTGYLIGNKILSRAKNPLPEKRLNHFLTAALGVAILSLIELIPVVNIFVILAVICFGVGLTLRTLFYKKK